MINAAVRNSIRGSGRQTYPHQVARALPRTGLLLYLGRPNLEAADAPIGDDTEIGDDTIIRWMFLLPADADIRAATGWVSGVGNIFYDAAGDPVAVLASEIVAWSSINQWNVLFHLVSADTETGRLAIYAVDTPVGILDKALKVLRAPEPYFPSAFFNGEDFRLAAYIGGPTYVPDHLGVLRSPGANRWAVQGKRLATTVADGAVFGPEVLSAGAVACDSTLAYTAVNSAILAAVDGKLTITVGAGKTFGAAGTLGTLTVGKLYKLSIYISSSGGCSVQASGSVVLPVVIRPAGIYEVTFIATQTSLGLNIVANSPEETYLTFDSPSVKEVIPIYINTDESGNPIIPSTPQKTVTYSTDWTTKTFAEIFDKFDISDPLKAPGWLCEPPRTNAALPSAAPVTHTTGTLAVGTYTLWQEGTGSIVATAGTAVGTFGTASNGASATITITTAGTVVLTASGANTWVQLELGAFKTSRIYTTTAPVTRAATVASFPTAGKIPVNNFAIRMIVVPRASGQGVVFLFGSYIDVSNSLSVYFTAVSIYFRKKVSGVDTYASSSVENISNTPIELICTSSSTIGMQISARTFSSSWGSFTDGTANSSTAAKANAPIASTYQLGALSSGSQFIGNISLFDCVPIPTGITDPMAWAKTHWGVA